MQINGTSGSDSLFGTALADTIDGLGGNDSLYGNGGNDWLDGGTGTDAMGGGTGDDTYVVDSAGDVVFEFGDEGNDSVLASVSYTLAGSVENLSLSGSAGLSGTGNTVRNEMTGNAGNNLLDGRGGNDWLRGGLGADTLLGGTGTDTLDGGVGADVMAGGADDDSYTVDDLGDVVLEFSGEGRDRVYSSVGFVMPGAIEQLTLTGTATINGFGNALDNQIGGNTANNTLDGGDGNDNLFGDAGVDVLIGGAGDDFLQGSIGADVMNGGAGNDTYIVENAADVVIDAGPGLDEVSSTVSFTLPDTVERLRLGGTAAINGFGNDLDNVITGNAAANLMKGGGGNDQLSGGGGADTMVGGTGHDSYSVDNTGDVVIENPGEGTDFVLSTIDYTLGADVESLMLWDGGTAVQGHGNALNNSISGNAVDNILSGGDGHDAIDGGLGNDTMAGGTGDDYYYVERAGDVVNEGGGQGTDTVATSTTYVLSAITEVEGLVIRDPFDTTTIDLGGNQFGQTVGGNDGSNRLFGFGGADRLEGRAGFDQLFGGGGDDVLIGGAGGDDLTGDDGADQFAFVSTADTGTVLGAYDLIRDFDLAEGDRIRLDQLDADDLAAGVQAFTFVGAAAFTAPGQVSFTATASDTYILLNTDADAAEDAVIWVAGSFSVTAGWFVL